MHMKRNLKTSVMEEFETNSYILDIMLIRSLATLASLTKRGWNVEENRETQETAMK